MERGGREYVPAVIAPTSTGRPAIKGMLGPGGAAGRGGSAAAGGNAGEEFKHENMYSHGDG